MPAIPAKVKQAAKELYFSGVPTREISRTVNVQYSTLMRWIMGNPGVDQLMRRGWKFEKEDATNQIVEEIRQSNVEPIAKIYKVGLPLIHNALVKRYEQSHTKPVTVAEAKQIADILTTFDKMLRLSQGLATDIVEIHDDKLVLKDIRQIFMQDQFLETIDTEKGTEIADPGTGKPNHPGTGTIQISSGDSPTRVEQGSDPFANAGENNSEVGSGT